ncbi:MAG: hypothetical protein V4650_00145 [Pseudomonadota bacterium]
MLKAQPQPAELVVVAALLTTSAALIPGPLYVVAISLFGLPHVIWELAFIRRTYGTSLPRLFWRAVVVVLVIQLLGRLASWDGLLDAQDAALVDLLTLCVLVSGVLVALLASSGLSPRLLVTLTISALLIYAVSKGQYVAVLMLLAVAHNFTPIALLPASTNPQHRTLAAHLRRLFLLPFLLAAVVLALTTAHLLNFHLDYEAPAEVTWLGKLIDGGARAIFSGLVLAQCLHYYTVLRLLPASSKLPLMQRTALHVAIGSSALMALAFAAHFDSAKQLYALAAGAHAWLEWPVILLIASVPLRQSAAVLKHPEFSNA